MHHGTSPSAPPHHCQMLDLLASYQISNRFERAAFVSALFDTCTAVVEAADGLTSVVRVLLLFEAGFYVCEWVSEGVSEGVSE